MTILQVAAPSVSLTRFHVGAPRVVASLTTLIRYTVNGVRAETADPNAVPTTALIHGRVTR